MPIRDGMFVYPGDPEVRLSRPIAIADGAPANVSRLDYGVHSGTHVDAPLHFLPDGKGAETIPQELLSGPAEVVDATSLSGPIDARGLESVGLPDCRRLLLKTTNSKLWDLDHFSKDFIALNESGARLLVDRGVHCIGIDYLSIGDQGAHRVLLSAGVTPLESLDLRAVEPGRYNLHCMTLKIAGSDGAPARALLEPLGT